MSLLQQYKTDVDKGDLHEDPAQVLVLKELDRIKSALAKPAKSGGWFSKKQQPPKGLYLWGGVGRGKSMLMDRFADCGVQGIRRVHFHAFMQEVHTGMAAARKTGVDDALRPVAEEMADGIRCLAFDEMQITDITDAMIVGRLFEALLERDIVIVATSNRVPDDLYKDGLNRALFVPFIQILKDRMVVHELASPTDYRQNRLTGRKVFFAPLGSQATQELDRLWQDLSGGPGEELKLEVNGREVVLPEFRNGVARTTFKSLCGSALGPADYLAVAQAVKVLILDEIPTLGPANNNEAKRFVTLIDALYEARVQFVASAAADPEHLYPKGAGSFEFERTASRLREMQAESWTASDSP